jgi:hypothetical protein
MFTLLPLSEQTMPLEFGPEMTLNVTNTPEVGTPGGSPQNSVAVTVWVVPTGFVAVAGTSVKLQPKVPADASDGIAKAAITASTFTKTEKDVSTTRWQMSVIIWGDPFQLLEP